MKSVLILQFWGTEAIYNFFSIPIWKIFSKNTEQNLLAIMKEGATTSRGVEPHEKLHSK